MLIEMLAVMIVVVLLAVGIGTGLNAGVKAYRESIYDSDSATLSDILNTSIGDVLRYSTDVTRSEDGESFTFTSYDYNVKDAHFALDENGKVVMVFTKTTKGDDDVVSQETVTVQLVNDGAYTDGMTVSDLTVTPVGVENGYYFDISYKIIGGDGQSSEYTLRVRQANADIKAEIDTDENESETETETDTDTDEGFTVVFDSGLAEGERMVFTNVFGGKSASVTKTVRDNSFSTNIGEVSRKGYTISGWSLTKGAAVAEFGVNVDVTVTDSMKNTAKANGNVLTLYAVWNEVQYHLVYVPGEGATGSFTQSFGISTASVTLYTNIGTNQNKFSKTGHTVTFKGNGAKINGYDETSETAKCSLVGWAIGSQSYGLGDTLQIKDNETLWNLADEDGNVTVQAKWSEAKITTPDKDKVIRANWTMWGFSETQYLGSGMTGSNNTVGFGQQITVSEDKTYYVQCSCEVKYYSDKACTDLKRTETYYDGAEYKLASAVQYGITQTGYTFAGWYKKGTSTKVGMAGEAFAPEGNTELYATFNANTYTVVFHKNDGTDTTVSKTVTYGQTFALSGDGFTRSYKVTFERNGKNSKLNNATKNVTTTADWTLASWNKKTDGTGDSFTYGQSVSNLTAFNNTEIHLYAQWTGGRIKAIPTATWTNWTFKDWQDTATTSTTYTTEKLKNLSVAKAMSFKPRWKCTVSFDSKGGSSTPTAQDFLYESTSITLPASPTKTGYGFAGWFASASGGNALNNNTAASYINDKGSTTLYAQWSRITVTFNANGGSCSTASLQADETTGTVTLPSASRTGYTLKGWYTKSSDGSKAGGAGEGYKPTNSLTLYAQWSRITVTFNANGGSCSTASLQADETTGTVTLPSASRTGYTLKGWYTKSSDGSKAGGAGEGYKPTNSLTLYAQWTPYTYKVIFHSNYGKDATKTQTFTYGTAQKLTGNSFTRSYTVQFKGGKGSVTDGTRTATWSFNGWNTKSDGSGTGYTNQQSVSNLTSTQNGTVDLYAQWIGGKIASVPEATRTNWTLADWKSTNTGTNETNAALLNKQFTQNDTYTAQWKCTVSFDTGGYGTVDPVEVREGNSTELVSPPARTGAIFAGWRIEQTKVSSPYTPTSGHITLVAYWIASTYVNVPETIYLEPSSGNMTQPQYFVNNTFDSSTKSITPVAEAAQTSGVYNFFNADAETLTVTVTAGGTTKTLLDAKRISSVGVSGGGSYSGTIGTKEKDIFKLSSSSALTSNGTALAEWQFTYQLKNGTTCTAKAYTVLYAPNVGNSSVAASLITARYKWGIGHWLTTRQATWLVGVHSVESAKTVKENTKIGNDYIGSYRNALITGVTTNDTEDPALNFLGSGTGAGQYYTDRGVDVGEYREGGNGLITVDKSRYTNYNQIPNLKIGLDLITAMCYRNYQQHAYKYGLIYYEEGSSYKEVLTERTNVRMQEQAGNLFTKSIDWSISTSATQQTIKICGRTFAKRDKRQIDCQMAVYLKATIVDKSALRNLVQNVSQLGIQSAWLNGVKGTDGNPLSFSSYEAAMQNAYYVLGKPTATASEIATAYNNLSKYNVEAKDLNY